MPTDDAVHDMPLPPKYTSRIQKGGALFDEMRQLVRIWTDAPLAESKAAVIRLNPLNKATRARVVDVLGRIFVPRYAPNATTGSTLFSESLAELPGATEEAQTASSVLTGRAQVYSGASNLKQYVSTGNLRDVPIVQYGGWKKIFPGLVLSYLGFGAGLCVMLVVLLDIPQGGARQSPQLGSLAPNRLFDFQGFEPWLEVGLSWHKVAGRSRSGDWQRFF